MSKAREFIGIAAILSIAAVQFALGTSLVRAARAADDGGPVVLTVTGNAANTNRTALNKFDDAFLNHHNASFKKAFVFTRETLAALGMRKLTTRYPGKDLRLSVEGPLLRDVLAAAGAQGKKVFVQALDGYAAEIAIDELKAYPIILALKRDGHWLGLGGRGPAWVVYPIDDYPALAKQGDAKWVWAAFHIKVE